MRTSKLSAIVKNHPKHIELYKAETLQQLFGFLDKKFARPLKLAKVDETQNIAELVDTSEQSQARKVMLDEIITLINEFEIAKKGDCKLIPLLTYTSNLIGVYNTWFKNKDLSSEYREVFTAIQDFIIILYLNLSSGDLGSHFDFNPASPVGKKLEKCIDAILSNRQIEQENMSPPTRRTVSEAIQLRRQGKRASLFEQRSQAKPAHTDAPGRLMRSKNFYGKLPGQQS